MHSSAASPLSCQYRTLTLLCLLVAASGAANAQAHVLEAPVEKERIYILADSAQWRLAFHIMPVARATACEVATRKQPGAVFRRFFEGRRTFTVYLMASAAPIQSFVLQFDEKRPIVRKPTDEERRNNVLHIRGSQLGGLLDMLAGASRLRLRVLYPEKEKQDLEIDLTGFTPLYGRAMQLDCTPPEVIEAHCQHLEKNYPRYKVLRAKSGHCRMELRRPRPPASK